VTIDRIEIFPVRYPMTGYFKFFAAPDGRGGRAAILVKVTQSDGRVGWGQSVPIARWSDETPETAEILLRHYFIPALLGHDARDIPGAHAKLDAALAPGFSTGAPITRAGLDLALWDLAGKRAGQPLHRLWGLPAGGPLTLSWTVNPRTLDEVPALLAAGRARGYRHFNIKVAPDPDFDVQLARAVRAAAPEAFLWADANGGYEPEAALHAARRLAEAGVDVLEAPLRPNRIRGYQALKKLGALPIYLDEGVVEPRDLEEFIALGMLDGMAMKPARCGGLTSQLGQLAVMRRHGLPWLGSGLTDPDLSLAAAAHVYAAHGLTRPAALNGPQFLAEHLLKTPLRVEAGALHPPAGPGLGVDVDEVRLAEWVAAAAQPARP
jgi:L-alanine-DL-glutamate epimerase-like enolase superfamily enzyme